MSLNLVKRNSGSPFQLQRSIVDQGGEGGAYESGGYTGKSTYNNDAANAAMQSFGATVGAALSSRTPGDKNKADIKSKERLEKKSERLTKEGKTDRATKVTTRVEKKKESISKYEEEQKKKIPKANLDS